MSLKIYYLSTEIDPFAKTDSLSSFSKEFSTIVNNNKDCDIRLIQPKYNYISDRRFILREVIRLKDLLINFGDFNQMINLRSGFIPNTKVQVYFMEHEKYFDVSELIYKSKNGRLYNNNHEKFSFFTFAALDALKKLFWIPDIVIYNNWQTSLCPVIMDEMFSDKLSKTKKVFIVHSINDSYNFNNDLFSRFNLDSKKNKLVTNNLLNSIKRSDVTFFMDDEKNEISNYIKKDKNIKKILNKKNHKIFSYHSEMDPPDRIDIYNNILSELKKNKK